MNEKIFKIYQIVFVVLLLFLVVLIFIPFVLFKSLVPYIWGESKHLIDVLSSSAINLLIGLIASAALAYLTALISYQNEIKQEERSYLSDVLNIKQLCTQTVTPDTIDQIIFFFSAYQQRHKGFIESKTYKKRVLRKHEDKENIERFISNIEKDIEKIQGVCLRIMHADRFIRYYQDDYILSISQTLSSNEIDEEKKESKEELDLKITQIKKLKTEIANEMADLSLKTSQLSKDCDSLKKYLE